MKNILTFISLLLAVNVATAQIYTSGAAQAVVVDTKNTRATVLTAGSTFTGYARDVSGYSQVNVLIYGRPSGVLGDASSAKASFFFEFSKDSTNWDVSVPGLIRDPGLVIPIPIINVGKYFRVRYLNDGGVAAIAALGLGDVAGTATTQTTFRLTTYLLPNTTKELTRTMDQGISGNDPASVVRAGVMGKNPSNSYVNKPASGEVSTQSTTATLADAATFTGSAWENIEGYSSISVAVNSDNVGLLTYEMSPDGTNTDNTITRTFTKVSSGQSYVFTPTNKFCRIKFTNQGGDAQTFMRMKTVFKAETVGPVLLPVSTPLSDVSLAQVVVAVQHDGLKNTYSATATGLVSPITPTDIVTITGSATKTIRVLNVEISGTRTAAGTSNVFLLKRSTANSGGTSTTPTAVPHDGQNAAASAVVRAYTVNPTTGTLVANVRVRSVYLSDLTANSYSSPAIWDFGSNPGQAVVLRGTGEVLALNLGAVTVAGNAFNVSLTWTEE